MHGNEGSVDERYPMSSLVIVLVRFIRYKRFRIDPRPASESLACSNCPHCVAKPSRLCCDTCNPGSFFYLMPSTEPPKQSRAPNKFKVDSGGYLATDADRNLKAALQDWRLAQLRSIGIPNGDDMFGVQLIMIDDVLERIVDLAHFNKIDGLAALQGQVNWRYSDRWGLDILNIVNTHFPPVIEPPPSPPSEIL